MNPYATYKKQSVTTMTPIEAIVKLYDECERQLHRAVQFIKDKNFEEAHKSLNASSEIVEALRSVLDMSMGEISQNLDSLYNYFFKEIVMADTKKDIQIIENIIPQITELKEAFTEISKLPRDGVASNYG
jgi:flagellar protein FliS